MDTYTLEQIQSELKYAYKWMARATDYAKKGQFECSSHCMTVSQQYWNNCQHYKDKYITDEKSEQLHWDFISTRAMALAKQELEKESDDE